MAKKIKVGEFLKGWQVWGLPAFVVLFAPWQEELTSLKLISDWFQPELNTAASLFGALTTMIIYASTQRFSYGRLSRISICCFSVLVFSFVACFSLHAMVDVVWFPAPGLTIVIWIFWVILYLLLFCSFGAGIIAAGIIVSRSAQ